MQKHLLPNSFKILCSKIYENRQTLTELFKYVNVFATFWTRCFKFLIDLKTSSVIL